jgi:hypothetical protein
MPVSAAAKPVNFSCKGTEKVVGGFAKGRLAGNNLRDSNEGGSS